MSVSEYKGIKINAEEVKKAAFGRWPEIFKTLAPELSHAIGRKGHSNCPFPSRHRKSGGKNKFRLDSSGHKGQLGSAICSCGSWSNGFNLLEDLSGQDFRGVLEDVAQAINFFDDTLKPSKLTRNKIESTTLEPVLNLKEDKRKKKSILSIWRETLSLDDVKAEPARLYFQSRGFHYTRNDQNVRFHPNLPFYEDDGEGNMSCLGYFPAIVCAVRDVDKRPITLHRIYLTKKGTKAPFQKVKKMMEIPDTHSTKGCSINLSPENDTSYIGIAEGLETAESVSSAMLALGWNMPMECTINATLMERYMPKEGIKMCYIWADKDLSERGIESANKLKKRLWKQGIKSMILLPSQDILPGEKSLDWNDVLMNYGPSGFPLPNNHQETHSLVG